MTCMTGLMMVISLDSSPNVKCQSELLTTSIQWAFANLNSPCRSVARRRTTRFRIHKNKSYCVEMLVMALKWYMTKETLPSLSVKIQRSSHQTLGAFPQVIMKNIFTYRRPGMPAPQVCWWCLRKISTHLNPQKCLSGCHWQIMAACFITASVSSLLISKCSPRACSRAASLSYHPCQNMAPKPSYSQNVQGELASVWINCLKRDCLKYLGPILATKTLRHLWIIRNHTCLCLKKAS